MAPTKSFVDSLSRYFVPRHGDATLEGNFFPPVTDTYNLGLPTKRWGTIYAQSVVADSLTGGSVDADTVDGFHASGTPTAGWLLALDGSAVFPTSVYASALLVDGTRTLTGNLPVVAGITVDGVDISVLKDDFDTHIADFSNPHQVSLEQARQVNATVTGQITFNSVSAEPPIVLDIDNQGQTVVGFRADQLNKSITAGNGLTGGGLLTDNRTLTVQRQPTSGLQLDGTGLAVGQGAGLTVLTDTVALTTPGTLTYATANSSTGSHTHAISANSNVTASVESILKSDSGGDLFLAGLGIGRTDLEGSAVLSVFGLADQIDIRYDATYYGTIGVDSQGTLALGAYNNVMLDPSGDVTFDPTANNVYPFNNYDLNLGLINKKWLTIHAAELWVETLVAQDTMATIGGRIVVAPTTKLTIDINTSATTITVEHNQMTIGDIAWMMADGKFEMMSITGGPVTNGDAFDYTVTRNIDGTGANDWYAGDAVVNTGQGGAGYIDLYSQWSANSRRVDYVLINDGGVLSANLTDQSNYALFPAVGAVNDALYLGMANLVWSNVYFYIGTAASWTGVTLAYEYYNGTIWTSFSPTSTPSFTSTGWKGLEFDGSTLTGWSAVPVGGTSAYWIRIRVSAVSTWTTSPAQATRRIVSNKNQWGPTIVGWNRNSTTFNDITERWAIGNLSGLYGYGRVGDNFAPTYGFAAGKFANGSVWVAADDTYGFRIVRGANPTTTLGQWDTSGNISVGSTASEHVYITSTSVQIKDGVNVYTDLTAGTLTLGLVSGGEYVTISSSGLTMYTNNVSMVDITSAGAARFGSASTGNIYISGGTLYVRSSATNVMTFPSSGNGTIIGSLDITGAGVLTAGNGSVTLNNSGINLIGSTSSAFASERGLKIRNPGNTADMLRIWSYQSATGVYQSFIEGQGTNPSSNLILQGTNIAFAGLALFDIANNRLTLNNSVCDLYMPNNDITSVKDISYTGRIYGENPAFRAYRAANQTIPNNAATTLLCSTENRDQFALHNTSTGVFTTNQTGWWLITATVEFAANATGTRSLSIYRNLDSVVFASVNDTSPSGTYNCRLQVHYLGYITSGTAFDVRAYQNSGGDLNAIYNSQWSPTFAAAFIN